MRLSFYGDLVIGSQVQPGSKVLDGRLGTHVCANFAQHLLDGQSIHAINLGQIDTGHPIESRSQIEVGLVFAPFGIARCGWRRAWIFGQIEPHQSPRLLGPRRK